MDIGHDRIRAQEPAQFRRIKTRAVVIDPQPRHLPLTCEQLIGVYRARRPTSLAVGIVFLPAEYVSASINDREDWVQVVNNNEEIEGK